MFSLSYHSFNRQLVVLFCAGFFIFGPASFVMAGPDPVVVDGNVATATGDQSDGIASGIDKDFLSPPVNTLNVNALSREIEPATGTRGIDFRNRQGGNVNVHSGAVADPVAISTTGAEGIFAESLGTPPTPAAPDPFLRVRIPGDPGIDGGEVVVESYGSIMTEGDGAYGISAHSATTGYSQQVIDDLENFSENGFAFEVTSVENPDGTQGELGNEIAGVVIDPDTGEPFTDADGNPITAGTFVLNRNGTYTFNPVPDPDDEDNPINMLAPGESLITRVLYLAQGTNTNPEPDVLDDPANGNASLIVKVVREEDGRLTEVREAYFDRYGVTTKPTPDLDDPEKILTVFPDLKNYVNGLLGDATAGGAGNSVTITSAGAIQTQGNEAYGIYAQTEGGSGGKGRNGSISHGSGQGGGGKKGGSIEVNVIAGGTITTSGEDSAGIIALTRGGNGGNGGDGGFWRYGARGGTGGDGGDISVDGIDTIETSGDSASGVIALSTGGDGGKGGSGSVFTGGQSGGFGGKGGTVRIEGILNITTQGEKAHGIWAKSTGGNAGAGGSGGWISGSPGGGGQATDGGSVTVSSGGAIETSGSDAFGIYGQSVGGFGGKGGAGRGIFYAAGGDGNSAGSGGAVTVTNREEGSVTTHGARSHAIFAQSVGGGGGSGGGAGSLVALGGDAGAGGDGGSANVVNAGKLTTEGDYAYGLLAQSVGGGGGDGGGSGGLGSFGGTGSGGGDGGSVVVTNAKTSVIKTTGLRSHAIIAQSIGGGGGTGGSSSGFAAIGGSGSGGGIGDAVTVDNRGRIEAYGSEAIGIFAESVGGGGGDGGSSGGLVAVGGSGSDTSKGGAVTITNSGSITAASNAIFAQSIGGGGGNGGSSSGWFSIGGSGGGGGDASSVLINNSGQLLQTSGVNSSAVFAQSIGGGGGNGGNSSSVGAFVSLAIGGEGAAGGKGDDVTVNSSNGVINTFGNSSHAIQAQSVGGGGGNGGFAFSASGGIGGSVAIGIGGKGGGGGDSGQVNVVSENIISTIGDDANGIFAESIGGGGGSGGFAIALAGSDGFGASFAIGGAGGDGGSGKAVDVVSTGSINTSGNRSHGIQAQSVGGGGGNGGFSVAVAGGGLGAFSLGLGGSGGGGGDSDTVNVDNSTTITTLGREAYGLFAQSVGGGGGNGGFNIAAAGAGVGAGAVGIGGFGGDGGNSKSVTVNNQGKINTSGEKSIGLFVQSVGGGGGNGGFSVSGAGAGTGAGTFNLGGSGGGGGDSDIVLVDSYGNIITRGTEAHGLLAQSIGGGGGNGGFSISGSGAGTGAGTISIGGAGGDGGNSKSVTVNSFGTIGTSGDNAVGLFAQSVGGGGGNGSFSISGSGAGTGAGTFNLGGSGGGGGNSDTVVVNSHYNITTVGFEAHGLFAQSVGGGGGNGGFGITGSGAGTGAGSIGIGGFGGDGGNSKGVTVSCLGEIDTSGDKAIGLFAQSVGGGGGSGSFSISGSGAGTGAGTFNLGGAGGGGGDSDFVTVDASGHIVTRGTEAYGILAQSVGGGGGNGGFSITGSGAGTGSGSIGIGGFAGDGGDGKAVTVNNESIIDTYGHSATGLFAQSIGGGGGTGGFSIAGSGAKTGSGSFSLGGSGGLGGHGDSVVVNNQNSISTDGELSYGIVAQSVGGGGGAGGFSFSGGVTTDGFIMSASVGGAGGAGGNAGSVNLTNDGLLTTSKSGSHAILAQSVGGGGGSGGFSGSLTASAGSKPNISVSVGGSGGVGGDGDSVQLDNHNAIYTGGVSSYGLFAQSVGGGGGDGGGSFAAALGSHESGANLSVSVGGFGGAAGNAGNVVVGNDAAIITEGIKSHGIAGQSIGGGGGTGGFSATGSLSKGASAKDLAVSIGGFGGVGGDAGSVSVHNTGSIYTLSNFSGVTPVGAIEAQDPLNMFNDGAIGILAQSIGGGGGNGGFSFAGSFAGKQAKNLSVSVGGSGGAGGKGMGVNVINENTIDTTGAYSYGILAQSIGGGGGNGGASVAIDFGISDPDGANQNVAVSVGGGGGDANIGGAVDVVNSSGVTTRGYSSHGILVQSIGGGGGNGGYSLAGTISLETGEEPKQPVNVSMAIGGGGGDGSHGGTVTIDNSSTINTYQDGSSGIFAQSIGGGGGTGGSARALTLDVNPEDWIPKFEKENLNDFVSDLLSTWNLAVGGSGGGTSDGSSVTIVNKGNIVTQGAESHGIFAQSVGGGGGLGGDASHGIPYVPTWLEPFLELTPLKGLEDMQIVVGGSGGSSGHGDDINVTNECNITTLGNGSSGIFLQSVGGGGGVGGSGAVGLVGNIGIGGAGGASGDGGDVTVSHDGMIETYGSASYGIFAQSIGGGGGLAGNVDRGLFDFGIGLTFAQPGGGAGDGGEVTVQSNGDITTHGTGANGIFAQSVGGGGGIAGEIGVGIGFAGSVGGDGSGGTVSIAHIGNITTFGDSAHGIVAQSTGGKDLGSDVDIELVGDIVTQGVDSNGILAQSRGDKGAGNISIIILNGTVQGGSGQGRGVYMDGGDDNKLINTGSISALSAKAIIGGTGNDTIHNFGTVTGDVSLGAGNNAFTNFSKAIFNSGPVADIGIGCNLVNAGTLSPGGSGSVITTALTGNLTQANSSNYFVDLDLGVEQADRLNVSGVSDLDGSATINILNPGWAKPGKKQMTFLSSAGGVKDSGLSLTYNPSVLINYDLLWPNEKDVDVQIHITFSPEGNGLSNNQRSIGNAINKIQLAGGSEKFAPFAAELLNLSDMESVRDAYEQLSPESFDSITTTTIEVTRQYTQALVKRMHSIRSYLDKTDQTYGTRQTLAHAFWMDGFTKIGDQDAEDGFSGFDYNLSGIVVGLDKLFKDGLLGGVSYGLSHSDIDLDRGRGHGDIDSSFISLYGSLFSDRTYLDIALSYARQSYDNTRNIAVGALTRMAHSDHKADLYSSYAEAGYNFGIQKWVVQPFAALQYSYLSEEKYTELGADGVNLLVDCRRNKFLVSDLGLRVNHPFKKDSWTCIPDLSIAWLHDYDIDDRLITASFDGSPGVSFTTENRHVDKDGLRIGAGISLLKKTGVSLYLKYDFEIKSSYDAQQISGGFRYEF